MLPAGARLRRSADFTATLRASRAARGNGLLVVHAAMGPTADQPRIGFVVSRAVGPAVTRNLVRRRLRHAVRERLDQLPGGLRLVVRVLPPAASASYAELARALDRAMARATSTPLRQVTT